MLCVGDRLPVFGLTVVGEGEGQEAFSHVSNRDYFGKWLVLFTWPKDFTFICPTEIAAFGQVYEEIRELGAEVLGVSVDNEYVHQAWKAANPLLSGLPFALGADTSRELCSALGVIGANEGVALRSTFIVDPHGEIQHVSVNALDTGRNVDEVVRTLSALQAGGLTACGWVRGQSLLEP
jgi:peroxiredoxin (alkyl hydroperoxide reductase subunit C)